MNLDGYVACICEGSAERAIMDLLLEEDKLIFNRDKLLDGEIIRCRDGKTFESKYLRKSFKDKITVLRILDSRRENFKLSKAYTEKIDVINIITAPEIEMFIILNENKYENFKKSEEQKPSIFCKTKLKYKDVKSYDFVKNYFSNVDILLECIKEYKRISNVKNGEYTLCDLIK